MKAVLVSATLLSVITASVSHAASEGTRTTISSDPLVSGEGGGGGRGIGVASAANTTLLFVPDAEQSSLIAVGEGGEGGEGGRGKRFRKYRRSRSIPYRGQYAPYGGRPYGSYGPGWQRPGYNPPYYDRPYGRTYGYPPY